MNTRCLKVNFEQIDKHRFLNVFRLRVRPEQVAFVCEDLEEYVRGWAMDDHLSCYLIKTNSIPVGFFAIDVDSGRHCYLASKNDVCVLRCLFIDERHQGLGLASEALRELDGFLMATYPNLGTIFLTVNFKNWNAIGLYKKAGYRQMPVPYLGGSAGPQYILKKHLIRNTSIPTKEI